MTIVLCPGQSVEDLAATANQACPGCGGTLRKWGNARWRVVRASTGDWSYRPSRLRCRACGVTHVILRPEGLLRRRDAVVEIGRAWQLFAGGAGARRAARLLGLPMETVRGWLRRLNQGARLMYGPAPGIDRDRLGWALAHLEAEAKRAGWHAEQQVWGFVSFRSQGKLLSNTG